MPKDEEESDDESANEVEVEVEESDTPEKEVTLVGQFSGSLSGEVSTTVLEGSTGTAGSALVSSEKNERNQYCW